MYPKFHPPPSTHRITQAESRGNLPDVSSGGTTRRVVIRPTTGGTGSGDPAFRRVRTRGPAAWFASSSSALLSSSSSSRLRREIQFSAPINPPRRPAHRPFFQHSQLCVGISTCSIFITCIHSHTHFSLRSEATIASGANSKVTYLRLGNHVVRGHPRHDGSDLYCEDTHRRNDCSKFADTYCDMCCCRMWRR